MTSEIEERKKRVFDFFIRKKSLFIYLILALIVWFGYYIRTRNLPLLKDATTGGFIPADLDALLFLRYAEYIAEHGKLFVIDLLRNYPIGFDLTQEVPFLQYFIAYLYKFLHIFNPSTTVAKADVLYPAICFVIGLIFFFLLIRRLFDYRVALLSSAFLAVIPSFLSRTMAGWSDKEALAVMFMFMAFYFFVVGWQSKNLKKVVLFGILSGVATGLVGLTWGGVTFVFLIMGIFQLVIVLFEKVKEKDFYLYLTWVIFAIITLTSFTSRYTLFSIAVSSTSEIIILALFVNLVYFLITKFNVLNLKDKVKKLPFGVFSFLFVVIILLIVASIIFGPKFLITQIQEVVTGLIYPLRGRWELTVAESHQPYITNWIGEMGLKYVLAFIIGSIVLFWKMNKQLTKKVVLTGTLIYALFIFSFIFSRYKQDSILNGVSPLARFMYIGSFVIFVLICIIFYIYTFHKNKNLFENIGKFEKNYLLILVWFLIMAMAGKMAIRHIFVFAPITTVLVGYLCIEVLDISHKIKDKVIKIVLYAVVALFVISLIIGFSNASLAQAQHTGPIYNIQWQNGMKWARENTQESAVFAHWWDYGYIVQFGANRATVTDGGNAIGYWNYLMGRHFLTGRSDYEPIPFFYAHNVSYALIISDEIGKYPAYSSIGSDVNYDRYSWINTFDLDTQNTQEKRNETVYFYRGGFVLDEDLVYNNQIFPRGAAGIGGFLVSFKNEGNITQLNQPIAILVYNGKQFNIPLECIFFNNQEFNFPEAGIKGCLMLIPKYEGGDKLNQIGSALYLSERTRNSVFTQLYLFGKGSQYFELVYNDENRGFPLASVPGGLIGPLKIWKIKYPAGMKVEQIYLQRSFPDESVTKI